MTEPIAAQMLAAIPAGDDDDMVRHAFAFQHPQDDHTGAGFSVIVLVLAGFGDEAPGVVGGLGEFLLAAQFLDKGFRLRLGRARAARDGVFAAPVADDVFEDFHPCSALLSSGASSLSFIP